MESGYCYYLDHLPYNTLVFGSSITLINKFLQIAIFLAYLVYFYKFNLNIRAAQVTLSYSRKLFRIATAMGGSIGVVHFLFVLFVFIPEFSNSIFTIIPIVFFIQQAVVFGSLMCTKKIFVMCKAYLSSD